MDKIKLTTKPPNYFGLGITLSILPGQTMYPATRRFGLTSRSWPQHKVSLQISKIENFSTQPLHWATHKISEYALMGINPSTSEPISTLRNNPRDKKTKKKSLHSDSNQNKENLTNNNNNNNNDNNNNNNNNNIKKISINSSNKYNSSPKINSNPKSNDKNETHKPESSKKGGDGKLLEGTKSETHSHHHHHHNKINLNHIFTYQNDRWKKFDELISPSSKTSHSLFIDKWAPMPTVLIQFNSSNDAAYKYSFSFLADRGTEPQNWTSTRLKSHVLFFETKNTLRYEVSCYKIEVKGQGKEKKNYDKYRIVQVNNPRALSKGKITESNISIPLKLEQGWVGQVIAEDLWWREFVWSDDSLQVNGNVLYISSIWWEKRNHSESS